VSVADEQLTEVLDRLRGRFHGKYRGTVTSIDDPTLRIKAKVPAVLGDQETGWCTPCVPYAGDGVGFAFIPETGAGVWIEFEGGDVSYPIWSGCYWRSGEVPSDAKPTVKAIVTPSGNKVLLDDDGKSITVTDPNENKVTLDSNGVTIERGSHKVVVSDSSVAIDDTSFQVM
jgi:uncharacterized protein involved in type VI secretion and phage assembly